MSELPELPVMPYDPLACQQEVDEGRLEFYQRLADFWEARCRLAVEALRDIAGTGPCAIKTRRDCGLYATVALELIKPIPNPQSPAQPE